LAAAINNQWGIEVVDVFGKMDGESGRRKCRWQGERKHSTLGAARITQLPTFRRREQRLRISRIDFAAEALEVLSETIPEREGRDEFFWSRGGRSRSYARAARTILAALPRATRISVPFHHRSTGNHLWEIP
jgi:hypothetical protein